MGLFNESGFPDPVESMIGGKLQRAFTEVGLGGCSTNERKAEIADQMLAQIGAALVPAAMEHIRSTGASIDKAAFYRSIGREAAEAIDLFLRGGFGEQ
jgi:hypothetical protein